MEDNIVKVPGEEIVTIVNAYEKNYHFIEKIKQIEKELSNANIDNEVDAEKKLMYKLEQNNFSIGIVGKGAGDIINILNAKYNIIGLITKIPTEKPTFVLDWAWNLPKIKEIMPDGGVLKDQIDPLLKKISSKHNLCDQIITQNPEFINYVLADLLGQQVFQNYYGVQVDNEIEIVYGLNEINFLIEPKIKSPTAIKKLPKPGSNDNTKIDLNNPLVKYLEKKLQIINSPEKITPPPEHEDHK